MSEKRFIRNIVGNIYDSEKDKWFEEDWKGKPLDYDDDLIVFLNEQQALINALKKENKGLKEDLKKGFDVPLPYVENSMRRLRAEHKVDKQQATISKQLDKIIELQDKYRILEFNHSRLEKRNKAQYEKIDEQQATINLLLNLLYQSEETVINEYSSNIGEDMDKLDKIFKEKNIKEIERFVRGCDDE